MSRSPGISVDLLPTGHPKKRGDLVLHAPSGLVAIVMNVSGPAVRIFSALGDTHDVLADTLYLLPLQPGSQTIPANFMELVTALESLQPELFRIEEKGSQKS